MDETQSKIVEMIASQTSLPREKIQTSSRLYQDLEIYGRDATELLQTFSKQFKVDIGSLEFSKYFMEEPSLFTPFMLIGNLVQRIRGTYTPLKPITVGDLIRAAEAGKWTDS